MCVPELVVACLSPLGRLAPQEGLVPIGRDPRSGCWEFALLTEGPMAIPERDTDGRLVLAMNMTLVLVLLPGGTFEMGASTGRIDAMERDTSTSS